MNLEQYIQADMRKFIKSHEPAIDKDSPIRTEDAGIVGKVDYERQIKRAIKQHRFQEATKHFNEAKEKFANTPKDHTEERKQLYRILQRCYKLIYDYVEDRHKTSRLLSRLENTADVFDERVQATNLQDQTQQQHAMPTVEQVMFDQPQTRMPKRNESSSPVSMPNNSQQPVQTHKTELGMPNAPDGMQPPQQAPTSSPQPMPQQAAPAQQPIQPQSPQQPVQPQQQPQPVMQQQSPPQVVIASPQQPTQQLPQQSTPAQPQQTQAQQASPQPKASDSQVQYIQAPQTVVIESQQPIQHKKSSQPAWKPPEMDMKSHTQPKDTPKQAQEHGWKPPKLPGVTESKTDNLAESKKPKFRPPELDLVKSSKRVGTEPTGKHSIQTQVTQQFIAQAAKLIQDNPQKAQEKLIEARVEYVRSGETNPQQLKEIEALERQIATKKSQYTHPLDTELFSSLYVKAVHAMRQGDYQQAAQLLAKRIQQAPNDVAAKIRYKECTEALHGTTT